MNSKFYVSLEAEELLKEKGYQFVWGYDSIHPKKVTKAEAIDWLESKGFYIDIVYINVGKWACTITIPSREIIDMELSETRLEAEEAAIIKALELL